MAIRICSADSQDTDAGTAGQRDVHGRTAHIGMLYVAIEKGDVVATDVRCGWPVATAPGGVAGCARVEGIPVGAATRIGLFKEGEDVAESGYDSEGWSTEWGASTPTAGEAVSDQEEVPTELGDTSLARTLVAHGPEAADRPCPVGPERLALEACEPVQLMRTLARRGCNRVLWECGPDLAAAAIQQGCIQEVAAVVAPKLMGGVAARTPLGDLGFTAMDQVLVGPGAVLRDASLNTEQGPVVLGPDSGSALARSQAGTCGIPPCLPPLYAQLLHFVLVGIDFAQSASIRCTFSTEGRVKH